MTSLTLHALDDTIGIPLRDYARRERKSLNQSAKDLIAVGLGIARPTKTDHSAEYEALFGVIGTDAADEIRENLKRFEVIDEGKWK
jgi:hypothetical protein